MESLLAIIGAFLAIVISINAFFLRGTFNDLGELKIRMAEFFGESKLNSSRIDSLEIEGKELELRVRKLEIGFTK